MGGGGHRGSDGGKLNLIYPSAALLVRAAFWSLSRWEVVGAENVPPSGPLIIAANHMSFLDPPLVAVSIPRRVIFMTKAEAFHFPWSILLKPFGFPVRRGQADRDALRQAQKALERGLALGMFPEGGRSVDNQLHRAQPGLALIALRSGAPILPVGIEGSEEAKSLAQVFRHPHITVHIGPVLHCSPIEGKPSNQKLAE